MRTIAVLQSDLELTPLGTRSRLADDVGGRSVLRRTVERVRGVAGLAQVVVLCPQAQFARCARLLEGSGAELRGHDAPPPAWARLTRTARKWSLDSWRGGIGGTTVFDEYCDPRLLAGLLESTPADLVLSVPPASPLFDPALGEQMIAHRRKLEGEVRLVFTTAPPGVTGLLLDADLVRELAEKNVPAGWLFSYQPDAPRKDLALTNACMEIPATLRYAFGRLMADTDRATARVVEACAAMPSFAAAHGEGVGAWLSARCAVESLPREVEIELTTDDPFPDAVLRPRGSRVGTRGPIAVSIVERIARELAACDDSLVVLGGFGEPLRHPQWGACVSTLKTAGVYGVGVGTAGVDLDDANIEALLDQEVDVVSVLLDAWSPDLYGRLHAPAEPGRASLEAVRRRMDRLEERKRARGVARPIVVPQFTKSRLNLAEMEAFHDGWLRKLGASCITGFSRHGDVLDDQDVMHMAPPRRIACRRIQSRCLVLADGRVAFCDQDPQGRVVIGDLRTQRLGEVWNGASFQRVRQAHDTGRWSEIPGCAGCAEWHRP